MRVTIIGHGPSIENAGLGKMIDDSSDYVVRLSASYVSHNSIDHGDRTDYVCASTSSMWRLKLGPAPLYETWLYCPIKSYSYNDIHIKKLQAAGFNLVICKKEINNWLRRYRQLNDEWKKMYFKEGDRRIYSYFSIGMSAVIIASQRIDNIKELLLIGFDNMVKGSRENFVSLTKKRPENTSGHNYAVECQLLDEVVSGWGVKLITK